MSEPEESAETETVVEADERTNNTDVTEDVPPGERIASLKEERETLADEVERLRDERDDLKDRLRRTAADFENYKKRQASRREDLADETTEQLVTRLLDVRDNLKRAIQEEDPDIESLREGVKLTLAEFDRVLDAEEVSEIAPEPGTSVDPVRHEVMLTVDSEYPNGCIDEVYQPGYQRGDKVLRPAQVTVSDGSSDEGAEDR